MSDKDIRQFLRELVVNLREKIASLSLRVKLFIVLTGAIVAAVAVVGGFTLYTVYVSLTAQIRDEQAVDVQGKVVNINAFLTGAQSDAIFLSRSAALAHYLSAVDDGTDPAAIADARATLEMELLAFAQARLFYDQVRFLDASGQEIARVNTTLTGVSSIVAQADLQNKADRYYFQNSIGLAPEDVYVSPLDLNVERGEIEIPHKPVIRYATPVYFKAQIRGVIVTNVLAENFLAPLGSGQVPAFMVDAAGYYLYHPDESKRWGRDLGTGFTLVQDLPGLAPALFSGETGTAITAGRLFAFTPVTLPGERAPRWYAANYVARRDAFASVIRALYVGLGLIAVTLLVAFVVTGLLGRAITAPLVSLTRVAEQVALGDLDVQALVGPDDEIGTLATVFNDMTAQLRQTLGGLERRVAQRTRALELAVDVGRRLFTTRDLDELLAQAVELIRSRFDLYYVQIYLTDPSGRNLALRAGTGEAGAELVRRGHALAIGPGSINGVAAAERRILIVPDITQSAAFAPQPLLPDTRSEAAAPLLAGQRLVGVLDLQHDQAGFLSVETLPVLEVLSGQLSIAIDNAYLFAALAQSKADMEAQVQRMTRVGWGELLDGIQRGERLGYAYDHQGLEALTIPLDEPPAPHVLAAPIQVQDVSVGAIHVEGESERAWTQAEVQLVEAVARQVAQQAENLRLLTQARQYRAQAEQASRRLTREGWQEYLKSQAGLGAGFFYDRYEVKPLAGELERGIEIESGGRVLEQGLDVRGETIGQLSVGGVERVDEDALELLATVGERLSAHLENLRLLEETERRGYELQERSQELEASQRVTFAAAETSEPDDLLDLVVNLIRDQFNLYHAQVYLVDEVDLVAVLRKSTGYAGQQFLERGYQVPLDQTTLVARAIDQGQPALVDDARQDENWLPDPLLPHTRSQLALPLVASRGVIGALDVHSREPGRFGPSTVALLQTMAEQVAMSFENIDLLARTTRQTQELLRFTTQLRAAADIAARLSVIHAPRHLIQEIVTLIQSRFGLYHAHVYLLETPPQSPPTGGTEGSVLVVSAGSGEVGRVLVEQGHSIPLDAEKNLVARAAREQKIRVVNDTSSVSDFVPNPLLPQTRSEIAVPLIAGQRVLGVLDVHDDRLDRFGQSDVDTFSTLGGQIATALQNAAFVKEIQTVSESLREVNRTKDRFMSSMSHELRTPLNSIIGFSEVLLMGISGDLSAEVQADVQAIFDNGRHLLGIINDLLDLAKIESGTLELHPEPIEIAALFEDVRANNAGLLVDKPVEMLIQLQDDLPPLQADPIRINQILNNLVSNAAKFTSEGSITLRAYRDDEWLCLEVQDTGMGINEEDLERVFERFQQTDKDRARSARGTGLGLDITRQLVELHGGVITVRSQPGQGSAFTVRLPV